MLHYVYIKPGGVSDKLCVFPADYIAQNSHCPGIAGLSDPPWQCFFMYTQMLNHIKPVPIPPCAWSKMCVHCRFRCIVGALCIVVQMYWLVHCRFRCRLCLNVQFGSISTHLWYLAASSHPEKWYMAAQSLYMYVCTYYVGVVIAISPVNTTTSLYLVYTECGIWHHNQCFMIGYIYMKLHA